MRIILPSDFQGERYGYCYRLVNEEDAAFIVKLRTNPKVKNFLHKTSSDIESQKEWIREYKKREREGLEYYFIYEKEGIPCGVNRIYNIQEDGTFTSGSLVFDDDAPFEAVVAATMIEREIAFETLDLEYSYSADGVHVDNKRVIKFSKLFGTVFTGQIETEQGIFLTGGTKKEDFLKCASKIKKLMDFK